MKKKFLPPAGFEPTTSRLPLTENQIVKNGGVRGDADTPAHHDGYFEFVPILVTATKGAFNAYFGRIVLVLLFAINSFVKAEKKIEKKWKKNWKKKMKKKIMISRKIRLHWSDSQYRNIKIFLPLRFYMKSILEMAEVFAFLQFYGLWISFM